MIPMYIMVFSNRVIDFSCHNTMYKKSSSITLQDIIQGIYDWITTTIVAHNIDQMKSNLTKRLKKEVIYHMVNHISTIRIQPICFHLRPRQNIKKLEKDTNNIKKIGMFCKNNPLDQKLAGLIDYSQNKCERRLRARVY